MPAQERSVLMLNTQSAVDFRGACDTHPVDAFDDQRGKTRTKCSRGFRRNFVVLSSTFQAFELLTVRARFFLFCRVLGGIAVSL